jgi:hypothetical protein
MKQRRNFFSTIAGWLVLPIILTAACIAGCSGHNLGFDTEYQAVFLDNGQIFFGRLSDTNSTFITLSNVYLIRTSVGPDKKIGKSFLITLAEANEWHQPSFVRINIRHVVMIQPVGQTSRVARLLREAREAPLVAQPERGAHTDSQGSTPPQPSGLKERAPAPRKSDAHGKTPLK